MDEHIKDNILNLAKKNSKLAELVSEYDYYNTSLTDETLFIKFEENNITFSNENYLRKEMIKNIFNNEIKDLLNIKKKFILKINLHDNSHLEGVLTFGTKVNNHKSVLIPDLYQMTNYNESIIYGKNDNLDFNNKINKIIFCGSSTGSTYLNLNQRVNNCIWSLKNNWAKENTIFKITNIVQINNIQLSNYTIKNDIQLKDIMSKNISIKEQLNYKYILSIDGNTWAWDRPIWIMSSNSLFLKYDSDNIGWYYPFLKEGIHYVSVNENNMEKKYNFFENNSNQSIEIIKNSKKFVKNYCSEESWKFYLKNLLENISNNSY
jgi:hypothetical protein